MGLVQKLKRKFWYTRMLEGCGRLVKSILLVTNLLMLFGGILVLCVGVWTLTEKSFMARLLGSDLYLSSASILVATGGLIIIVSFLGCVGAFREMKCLLLTVVSILFMTFVVLLVGGILGYVFRKEVSVRLHQEMLMTIPYYGNDSEITDAWDEVQRRFECCGIPNQTGDESYKIWLQNNPHFNDTRQVPESCCLQREFIQECQEHPSRASAHLSDCHVAVRDFVENHARTLGGVGLGVATLLLIGMILSCTMVVMIQ